MYAVTKGHANRDFFNGKVIVEDCDFATNCEVKANVDFHAALIPASDQLIGSIFSFFSTRSQ